MASRYTEIADDLRERIRSGEYPPGAKLPGYRELIVTYSTSRDVIRRALATLETEGLIEIVKKAGIKVREQGGRRRLARTTRIMHNPAGVGYVFPSAQSAQERWVWPADTPPRRSLEPIPPDVAELLGVEPGSEVVRRRRVMAPEGEPPFDIIDAWIHPDVVAEAPRVAEISTGPGGYLQRIEEAGHGPISWVERARARMPTGEEARLLKMPRTGMPVMELARVGTSARTGQPVEVSMVVIPADRIEIVAELQRGPSARWPVTPVPPPEPDA